VRRPALLGPPLLAGAIAALLLAWPAVRLPGHRGAARVTEGFRPGLWDARFRVARGPAALDLPAVPVRATLVLSGPAEVTVRAGGTTTSYEVDSTPTPVELLLPGGGRAELSAVGPLRLHEVVLRRTGATPWGPLAAVLAAALGAALLVQRRPHLSVAAVAILAVAAAAAVALRGQFGAVVAFGLLDRAGPAMALLALATAFLLPIALPRSAAAPAGATRLALAFAATTLVSALLQVTTLPQPLLIGDPAAYFDIGGRFASALRAARGIDGLADAVQTLRPYGGLWATGLVYGLLRLAHDDLQTIYAAHAVSLAGAVFFLTRAAARIGGPRLAALTGALALLYPSWAVICGIVQPEPVILLLWTAALDRWLAGAGLRSTAVAGLLFALGLALHPQGMWFLLIALVIALAPFARALARPTARLRVGALAIGLLPVAAFTAAGEAYARPVAEVLDERYGFWAYSARYPLGFWLFIETDGWQGPLRLDETEYATGFRQAERDGRLHSAVDRWRYTIGFVASHARASLRTVLRNLDRLWRMPDNPFRRAWLLPYGAQLRLHRALVVLFLLAVPLAFARGAPPLLLPFAVLSSTYPLYHIFNKYAVPATPFVLLGAALALERLWADRRRALAALLAVAALAAFVRPAALALRGAPPGLARGLLDGAHALALAAAFVVVARAWALGRAARARTLVAAVVLLLPWLATAVGPGWRRFAVPLDQEARHEIASPALSELSASDAYLMLDLQVDDGDPHRLRLDFDGGFSLGGEALEPTMPPFGLATVRGGRDARTFPQWWRARWRPEMAPGGRFGLSVHGSEHERLGGDVGVPDRDGVYEGISLGEWPHLSVYRLMHDGEYRLAVRQRLEPAVRGSVAGGRVVPGLLGIRIAVIEPGDEPANVESAARARWRPVRVW
jgi:hypothetical protein